MFPIKKAQSWLPSIFNDFLDNEWVAKAHQTGPAINIMECQKRFKVEIATPGMTKDDFNIELKDDNQLVVTMEKKSEKESDSSMNEPDMKEHINSEKDSSEKEENEKEHKVVTETQEENEINIPCNCPYEMSEKEENKKSKYIRREFTYSQYCQTIILPDNVDKTLISAKQENGILTISLPKKEAYIEEQETKQITVE